MDNNFQRFMINVNLTHFIGAQIRELENDHGRTEKYVCIPMQANGIKQFKNDAYINLSMFESNRPLDNGWTHAVSVFMVKDMIDKLRLQGYKPPFIGKGKIFTGGNR